MQIAVIFINIGRYHAARLQAAYQCCMARGWRLTAVQVTDDTLDHPWGEHESLAGFPVKTLIPTNSNGHDVRQDVFSSKSGRALALYFDELKPDVVFVPGWGFSVSRAALAWCQRNRKICIVMSDSKEDDAPRTWWRELFKRRMVKRYNSAFAAGQPHKRYLVKLGMQPEAIFLGFDVVGNEGFRPELIKSLPRPIEQQYFLSISRFVPKKNLNTLIDAYASYLKSNWAGGWDLILCGDGPLRGEIESKIATYGIKDRVHLPGFLDQDQLLQYFGHASCFVHASITEQWGLVVNEAMAAGLPILLSNKCGCAEDLLLEGENGHSFDPEDAQALAVLMMRLSSGKVDLAAMGQCSLRQIGKFSPATYGESTVQAIEYALSHASPR